MRWAVSVVTDVRQALYREAQLALRAVVGARELDSFLTDKDAVADELADTVRPRAKALGLELIAVGIRDAILSVEMQDLVNKVTEAKKATEADLIARREETAAVCSPGRSAKLDPQPTAGLYCTGSKDRLARLVRGIKSDSRPSSSS